MDTKSKILVWGFIGLLVAVSLWKFNALVQRHDFLVDTHVACDTGKFSCFTMECDSESGEDCTNEMYAKMVKRADTMSLCNKFEEECPELECSLGEADCEITYCSDDALEEGESCVGPIVLDQKELDTEESADNDASSTPETAI
jgi:hypothetical protein